MKNVAVLMADGAFALFFHPTPGDLTSKEKMPGAGGLGWVGLDAIGID